MTDQYAVQRTPSWANDRNRALEVVPEEAMLAEIARTAGVLAGEDHPLMAPVPKVDTRSSSVLREAHEVGAWSLEYLGPGFHVQLRIARRNRQARLDGWMSPARPISVLLVSLLRKPVVLETRVGDSGRFEFPVAPLGACRMSFVVEDSGRPPSTPPFWV